MTSTSNFLTGTYFLSTTGAQTGGHGAINYGATASCASGNAIGTMYLDVVKIE